MGQDFVVLHYPKFVGEEYATVSKRINYEDLLFNEENRQYEPTIFEYVLETMKLVIFDNCYNEINTTDFSSFLDKIDNTQKEIEKFLLNQKRKSKRVFEYFAKKAKTFLNYSDEFVGLMNDRQR